MTQADPQPAGDVLAQLRQDVATANHIAHLNGLVNAFGHISARIPGTDTFYFPTRRSPALAHPDRLLVLDTVGNILSGEGTPNTEFWIHARMYAARPDVNAVAHVHSPRCVVLGQIGEPIAILHNQGAAFAGGVPLFDRVGLIRSRELGDQVAASMGRGRAMLLRGHGANIAEQDVRRAVILACHLEETAELQLAALAAVGGDRSRLRSFDAAECARLVDQLDNNGPFDRAWDYYTARLRGEVATETVGSTI